jgi:hypothetical protein
MLEQQRQLLFMEEEIQLQMLVKNGMTLLL